MRPLKPLSRRRERSSACFELKLEAPDLLVLRYHLAALKGDKEQMNQVVALAKGENGAAYSVAHGSATEAL
jgi:hypothetical protein